MSGGNSRAPYFEHDDRIASSSSSNRHFGGGKFKKQRPPWRNNRNPRGFVGKPGGRDRPRNAGFDDDVEMEKPNDRKDRYRPYMDRRKKNRRDRGPKRFEFANPNEETWFKVTIPHGDNVGKTQLYRMLGSRVGAPFIPYSYHAENKAAVFYVNDSHVANMLKRLNKQLTNPSGFKIAIFVKPALSPEISLDPEIIEHIKECMSKRYDATTGLLRLGRFVDDQDLTSAGHYAPLHRTSVMNAVVRIIKENIPGLISLDLSDNKLTSLEALSGLHNSCKFFKSLNLRNNRIRTMSELNSIKGVPLEELVLDGNPLCDDFRDQQSFISAVRERLPRVIKLDGQDLPPPIVFDLGTEEQLPESKGSFFPAQNVKEIVIRFLEEYFRCFDSEDRQGLLGAYHDNAMFSMSISKALQRNTSGQDYFQDNRNLMQMSDYGQRSKLLKQGKLLVVSTFSQMPLTQHDPNSFTIDVAYVLPSLMCFTVCGVFKEVGVRESPLRAFTRTFLVVPFGSGFVIINEMLYITNATAEQVKAFKFVTPTPNPSPGPSNEKPMEEKQQIVLEFMKFTNMNEPYSVRCLEENEWDYQKAASVFSELNGRGLIPPEAFKK